MIGAEALVPHLLSVIPVNASTILAPGGVPDALAGQLQARNPRTVVLSTSDALADASLIMVAPNTLRQSLIQARDGVTGDGTICVVARNSFCLADLASPGSAPGVSGGVAKEALEQTLKDAGLVHDRSLAIGARSEVEKHAAAITEFAGRNNASRDAIINRYAPEFFVYRAMPASARKQPVTITGATLNSRVDAMGQVRMVQPLRALATLPGFAVGDISATPTVDMRNSAGRDIFIWQRPSLTTDEALPSYRKILASHRLLVLEYDDHPLRWPAIAQTGHRVFRAAHAIRVSTEALADVVRPHNPNVFVSRNEVDTLPSLRPVKERTGPLRLLFAALNREADWDAYIDVLNGLLATRSADDVQVHVVFDRAFFDALQAEDKRFYPLLAYNDYRSLIAKGDIAWLPLEDNEFNRSKSDLKFIECAAHSVAVLASPTVYDRVVINGSTGLLYENAEQFAAHLGSLMTDTNLRAALVKGAHDFVATNRMRSRSIEIEAAWFRSLLDRADELEAGRRERMRGDGVWGEGFDGAGLDTAPLPSEEQRAATPT
jgi:hypothetical protein